MLSDAKGQGIFDERRRTEAAVRVARYKADYQGEPGYAIRTTNRCRYLEGALCFGLCDVVQRARVPDMIIHRRSVTQVSELSQTQTRFVLMFSYIIDVRLARKGQVRRVRKKGGGGSRCFLKPEVYNLASTGYNLLARVDT